MTNPEITSGNNRISPTTQELHRAYIGAYANTPVTHDVPGDLYEPSRISADHLASLDSARRNLAALGIRTSPPTSHEEEARRLISKSEQE